MSARTRYTFQNSLMSRAARAMFAFLFRNALPVDLSAPRTGRDELETLRRRHERDIVGMGLVTATTYRPTDPVTRRRGKNQQAAGAEAPLPRKRAS